jgi:hypothetical protein
MSRLYEMSAVIALAAALLFPGAGIQEIPVQETPWGSQVAVDAQVKQLQERIAMLEAQIQEVRSEAETLERMQYEQGISRDSFPEIVGYLQTQRVELTIRQAGLDARLAAIRTLLDEGGGNAVQEEMSRRMQKNIELLRQNYEEMQRLHERGAIAGGELRQAEGAMLQAEIEMLSMQADQGSGLEGQLQELSLERAEGAARLNMVEELLNRMVGQRGEIHRLDNLYQQQAVLTDELQRARQLVMEFGMLLHGPQGSEGAKKNENENEKESGGDR